VKILPQNIPKHHLIKGTGGFSSFIIELQLRATKTKFEMVFCVAACGVAAKEMSQATPET